MTERSVANPVAGATALGVGILTAILAVVLAFTVFAKPSGAQDVQITVEPSTVGFGAVEVGVDNDPRPVITIRNTGETDVEIGGADTTITGPDAGDFDLLSQVLDLLTDDPDDLLLDPVTGLPEDLGAGITLGAGDAVALQVDFDASAGGTREAVLELTDPAGNLLQEINLIGEGVDQVPTADPDCTITGTDNGETLTGTPNEDIICALGGKDRVNGLGANDVLRGGFGKDRLFDNSGEDDLLGQEGKDKLNAKDSVGGDDLIGGPKRDKIKMDVGDTKQQ